LKVFFEVIAKEPAAADVFAFLAAQRSHDRIESSCSMPSGPPDLALLAALFASNEDGATGAVEVALLEGERLADPEAGAQEQHDQSAESMAVCAVTDCAHDRDDLFDRRRVGGIPLALVSGRTALGVAGHGRR
jgi:hypothetical protein